MVKHEKEYTPHKSFIEAFPSAFGIYRDFGIARDIARLVKPKEEQNVDEPGRTTRD